MVIVAFLQNMWVKDPVKMQQIFDRHKDDPMFWNNMARQLLFAGCVTGRNIKKAFGEELAYRIIYDECTKEIAGNPRVVLKADLEHIKQSLRWFEPDLIITFGKHAHNAVADALVSGWIWKGCIEIIEAPHPAARQPDTMQKLKEVAERVREYEG